jgi:hypothetical protein
MSELSGIVVVSDEELFVEFMERFSPKQLQYAANLTEACSHCANSPGVMVVSVDQPSKQLDLLLRYAALSDVRVLGLVRQAGAGKGLPVDRLVPADNSELVFRAAAELLNERRNYPRVELQLALEVEGVGTVHTSTVSAVSLFVETEAVLETGRQVALQIPAGSGVIRGEATVARVGLGDSGNVGMVLAVSGDAACAFLRDRVRDALQPHYQQMHVQLPAQEQPEPNYGELNQVPDVADEDEDVYDEPATNVQDFAPVATGEQVFGLQARLNEQQKIIEKLVLGMGQLERTGPPPRAAAEPSQLASVEQRLELLRQVQTDQEKVVQQHDAQVVALGQGLEQVAEIASNVELSIKETDAALRRAQEVLQGQLDEIHLSGTEGVNQDAVAATLQQTGPLRERVAELTQRVDQLAGEKAPREAVDELQEQLGGLFSRLTQAEALASAAATPDALQLSAEALAQQLEQGIQAQQNAIEELAQRLEAQRLELERVQQQAPRELEERLEARLPELEQRLGAGQQAVEELEQRLEARLSELEQRLGAGQQAAEERLVARLPGLEEQLGAGQQAIEELELRLEARLPELEEQLGAGQQAVEELELRLEARLPELEEGLGANRQAVQELTQRLESELQEVEQRLEARHGPFQSGLDEASQRLVELTTRVDELAGPALGAQQEQLKTVINRLSKVESLASDAASQEALESSGEALLHRAKQLSTRTDQLEEALHQVTQDLGQAGEKAQQQERAREDAARELEKRLEGRMAQVLERVEELDGAAPAEDALDEREQALTRRLEAMIDRRLQEASRETAATTKELVSKKTAEALQSFEEIRTEVLDMLEVVIQQLGAAQGQLDEQARVITRLVQRLDRMQKE